MNQGFLQSSPAPVQQIMAGNPNWWNINNMRPPISHHQAISPFVSPSTLFPPPPSSSSTIPSWNDNNNQDQLPGSWSQLLMSGLVDEDMKGNMSQFQAKKLENCWEEQMLHHRHQASSAAAVVDVKQENSASSYVYGHANEDFQPSKPSWSQMINNPPPTASSPKSCVRSFSSNMLDFSTNSKDIRHPPPDRSEVIKKELELINFDSMLSESSP